MPVKFAVSNRHQLYCTPGWGLRTVCTPGGVLCRVPKTQQSERIIRSSVDENTKEIIVAKNGFLHGILAAYAHRRNVVIRPDDVWIAILSQFSVYLNCRPQERSKFVKYKEPQHLTVRTPIKPKFSDVMAGKIQQYVKYQDLVPWVLPNFSTTTDNDTVICSVVTMSTTKPTYKCILGGGSGIPYVTLEGTKEDWQSLLTRTDKLREFGPEAEEWAATLNVVLKRFVRAFDSKERKKDQEFWEKMIFDQFEVSTTCSISGWITAFCAWENDGTYNLPIPGADTMYWDHAMNAVTPPRVTFDGISFPRVTGVLHGQYEVEVTLVDDSVPDKVKKYECNMLAGHIGFHVENTTSLDEDKVRFAPQWFLYEKEL